MPSASTRGNPLRRLPPPGVARRRLRQVPSRLQVVRVFRGRWRDRGEEKTKNRIEVGRCACRYGEARRGEVKGEEVLLVATRATGGMRRSDGEGGQTTQPRSIAQCRTSPRHQLLTFLNIYIISYQLFIEF